jgi:NodT family efflux transporter outer membrane factor (OMF) lipoprotein
MLALGACASGARKPDVTLPAAYEAPAGAVALAPATLDRWWTVFGDPTLNTLEEEALRLSPDVKTQIARLREAGATRQSAIFQTGPTGDLKSAASRKHTTQIGGVVNPLFPVGGPSTDESVNFDVSWELDFLGGLRTARQAANADFAATRFEVESARASLVANVADSYFQARGLAIQLDDARESVRIEQELLRVAVVRAKRGLGATSDADRIAGDLAQAQSNAESLEAELHAAERLLLILAGRGGEPVESLPVATEVPDPPPLPEAVPGELLARRPDVRQADWQMRSAALKTKLAKEQVFPNLVLQPALGLSRSMAPGVEVVPTGGGFSFQPQQQSQATGFWSYGLGFTAPVLDIPRLLEDARAQGARTEQAVIAYEKAVQSAYGDAENALVRLSADQRRVKILEDGEARARRAYEAAKVGYAAGLDDLTTALQAEQTWRNDRAALTAERVQALRRAVQTYKALGGGWDYAAEKPALQTP